MDSLPFFLLEEILFRLDPKSLATMQCTNRSIKSHISDDPYFITEYLSRVGSGLFNISSFGSKLLFFSPPRDPRSIRNKDPLEIVSQILGTCSGLLLLFVGGLCVVNPLTKWFRFLDHSNSKLLPNIIVRKGNAVSKPNCIGFAVDQIDRFTQRFKIVCISELKASDPNKTIYQFEINTGGSRWRLSKTTVTCRSSGLMPKKKPVYVDGDFHWLRNDGSIVAFNPETEQGRLIPIEFAQNNFNSKILFAAADKELALISATEEVIFVYTLEKILTDHPKWVLVQRIGNGALEKKSMRYWNVEAYDGKCLVVREMKNHTFGGVIHGYDFRANKWGVMGLLPALCDATRDFYHFKPSLSVVTGLGAENVKTFDHKRISSLSSIMRLVDESSPYALKLLKKKETQLGKRLIEEETKLKMESSSKFMDVQKINKRRKLK